MKKLSVISKSSVFCATVWEYLWVTYALHVGLYLIGKLVINIL